LHTTPAICDREKPSKIANALIEMDCLDILEIQAIAASEIFLFPMAVCGVP
jgi:hypothetical protein